MPIAGRRSTSRRRRAATFTVVALSAIAAFAIVGTDADSRRLAGDGHGGVGLRRVGSFGSPVYLAHAPGVPRFVYVVQRGGTVAAVKGGHRVKGAFLDIRGRVSTSGERGLLSLAFDPRYRRDHLLYAYYTNRDGNIEVDQFRARGNHRVRRGSRRRIIVVPHPGAANHNGGTLAFGPGGYLYLATGDGGFAGDPHENAQNRNVLLGKVLRIDPLARGKRRYRVPKGNPFVGRRGRNEIYALGLRNPFRFSFDRGHILIGDVGQDRWEEVDYASRKRLRGANFGWDHFEGDHRFDYPGDNEAPRPKHRYVPPIFEYSHSASHCGGAACAITGGVVVHDRKLRSLRGRYLYSDFYKGQLRSFVPHRRHGRHDRALGVHVDHPSSIVAGPRHHVYVTSLDGPVYRLVRK